MKGTLNREYYCRIKAQRAIEKGDPKKIEKIKAAFSAALERENKTSIRLGASPVAIPEDLMKQAELCDQLNMKI